MQASTYQRMCDIILQEAGIRLGPQKQALVRGRLTRRMRTLRLTTPEAYLAHLEADSTGTELVQLLDALTTHVTSFWREPMHFVVLSDFIKDVVAARQRRIRLWSAACSTGQEAYSMAMVAQEAVRGAPVDLKLLATDLSQPVLHHAAKGVYQAEELASLPEAMSHRYFLAETGQVRVRPELRSIISFAALNLARVPLPMPAASLDVVFCRNVMMYFDEGVRQRLVWEFERVLRPGGLLFVSHTETLIGVHTKLGVFEPAVYRRSS